MPYGVSPIRLILSYPITSISLFAYFLSILLSFFFLLELLCWDANGKLNILWWTSVNKSVVFACIFKRLHIALSCLHNLLKKQLSCVKHLVLLRCVIFNNKSSLSVFI